MRKMKHYHVTFVQPTGERRMDTTPWTTEEAANRYAVQYFRDWENPKVQRVDANHTRGYATHLPYSRIPSCKA